MLVLVVFLAVFVCIYLIDVNPFTATVCFSVQNLKVVKTWGLSFRNYKN